METSMTGSPDNDKTAKNELPTLVLAYLGDAYFELLVRERLVADCCGNPSGKSAGSVAGDAAELSRRSMCYVSAVAQSAAVERLLPALTPGEEAVYKRGRNAKTNHTPRSASVLDYRRATGLETLFGYLCVMGESERAEQLFGLCFPSEPNA